MDDGGPDGNGADVPACRVGVISQGHENHVGVEGMEALDANEDEALLADRLVDGIERCFGGQPEFDEFETDACGQSLESLAPYSECNAYLDSGTGRAHRLRYRQDGTR